MSKYFSNINLNQNQLQNAVIHLVASDGIIASPVEGQIIYDQSSSLIKYWDGVSWVAANDLSIVINGDTGSTTLIRDEALTFSGGTNITSVVSTDEVTFNLDDSITLSTVNVDDLFAGSVLATDVVVVSVNAETIVSTDVDAYTVTANSLNSSFGYIGEIVASDIQVDTIYGDSGAIGTVVFGATDASITSGLVIASDLVVNGSITGDITASDVTGVLYEVETPDDTGGFTVSRGDTITYQGTANEIEVTSPSADTIQIGIVDNPTLSGNVTVTGDLTIQGTTTSVDSQTLLVNDPVLGLNTGVGTNNPNDLGFILERGSGDTDYTNIGLIWDETNNKFVFGTTLETASDTNITLDDYYPVEMGGLTVSSDLTVEGRITTYDGTTPSQGDLLIGSATGYQNGTLTVSTDTGLAVTYSDTNINVAIDIDAATDGSGITVEASDELLISDAGVEKRIRINQLGDLFVSHNETQSLSSSDQQLARQNISAAEIVKATFTGTGLSNQTYYVFHNFGNADVIVQLFDSSGNQVYADVNTTNSNYVSVNGNFDSETYTVRVTGTRGSVVVVSSSDSL